MVDITRDEVWTAIASSNFMVIGMVTARKEARTAGVMHAVHDGRVWFTTSTTEWKAKHLAGHPQVSVTVAIPKRIPLLPFVKIPAATVTFAGEAELLAPDTLTPELERALLHGLDLGEVADTLTAVAVRPTGDFITYGVGVSALGMRDTERARGRIATGAEASRASAARLRAPRFALA